MGPVGDFLDFNFPLNPACLILILMMLYEIIPTSLGSISSPIKP